MTDILEALAIIRSQLDELEADAKANAVSINPIENSRQPLNRSTINNIRDQLVNNSHGIELSSGTIIGGKDLERFIEYSNENPDMTYYDQYNIGKYVRTIVTEDTANINRKIFATDWHILNELDAKLKPNGSKELDNVLNQMLLSAISMATHCNVNYDIEKIPSVITSIYVMNDNGETADWCDANGISYDGLQEVAATNNKQPWEFLPEFISCEIGRIIDDSGATNQDELVDWLSYS